MRGFVKHTASSLAFIAILLVLIFIVSQIVVPKTNVKGGGMQDPLANGILSEPENTIDVLILGDSEAYSAINPLLMWRDYGLTSYCCATPAQKLCYSLDFLQKAFDTQTPKVVVLETDTIFSVFSRWNPIKNKLSNVFPLFVYHNRWKSLQKEDLSFTTNYDYIENTKGYLYSNITAEASDKNYMQPSDRREPIPRRNRRYLDEINSFCEEKGARLIFVSTPSTVNWNSMRHNAVSELSEDMGVEFIDMNMIHDRVPIDWKKDTRDKGDHMNCFGASKVTGYLGKYLSESGLLTDHRNDDSYAPWNKALDEFNKSSSDFLKK